MIWLVTEMLGQDTTTGKYIELDWTSRYSTTLSAQMGKCAYATVSICRASNGGKLNKTQRLEVLRKVLAHQCDHHMNLGVLRCMK